MADDFPSRSLEKVMIRLPDGMRDRLKAEAEHNKRSVNAEIVARLEKTLQNPTESFGISPIPQEGSVTERFEAWQRNFDYLREQSAKLAAAQEVQARELKSIVDDEGMRLIHTQRITKMAKGEGTV